MKALSLLQPWPHAILYLGKIVENRSWRTNFRGRFLIHAGKGFDSGGADYIQHHLGLPLPRSFPRGGIVGSAVLRDCVRTFDSPWFQGPYGFVLQNVREFPFRPWRGELGFFDVADEAIAGLEAATT